MRELEYFHDRVARLERLVAEKDREIDRLGHQNSELCDRVWELEQELSRLKEKAA